MEVNQVSEFGNVLLFIIAGIVFIAGGLVMNKLLAPSRPNEEKNTTYECGEEPSGSAWGRFNIRFYIVGLIFLLFEVEIIFLFPWATVFGQKELVEGTNGMWGWASLLEMLVFIGMLAAGLAYVWAEGHLNWVRPNPKEPDFQSKLPQNLYQGINDRLATRVKRLAKELEPEEAEA